MILFSIAVLAPT